MERLVTAILISDCKQAEALLKANPNLAAQRFETATLFESEIIHWIYPGDTALHLAAAGHRTGISRLLLGAGANPNAAFNHRRGTPLHYAADGVLSHPDWNAARQIETIQCLLEHGANLHLQDKNGATPLHRAVRTRCAEAVQCLLRAGANPLAPNGSGSTPFHLAVQNTGRGGTGTGAAIEAQRVIIHHFLSIGISPDVRCHGGKSVRESAQSDWIQGLLD